MAETLPDEVTIWEVGPRDGLQNESALVPTETKVEFIGRLVEASEMFTPADIEFAARKAAQRAFEREHFEGTRERARTEDFTRAIEQVRPTLTSEMLESFEAARRSHARY